MTYETQLLETLPRVRDRIDAARERSGIRHEVTILGVTKGHPPAAVEAAAAVGLEDVGENRVTELERKRAVIKAPVRWHLVGHLQRNKIRRALPLFDLFQAVDSPRLAGELSKEAVRAGIDLPVLIQVNASGEETKGGFGVEEGVDAVAGVAVLPGLRVEGLMTMAPLTDQEKVLRSTFARTRALFEECAARVPGFQACHLSMGMSNDFEIAVEEGSTMVRLGTVLFGERLA